MASNGPRQRLLYGFPRMTAPMMEALTVLHKSEAAGFPFVHLHGYDPRTLRKMMEHDWIISSDGLDGVRYRMTRRGQRAYQAYSVRTHRTDGLCPQCGERPRAVSRTGRTHRYCAACHSTNAKQRYAEHGLEYAPDSPCARCKQAPRHISKNGSKSAYCRACLGVRRQEKRERLTAEQQEAA